MKIDLLTMPGCPHCAHAKEVLERISPDYADLEVTIHDLAQEPELASRYMLMSAPGVVIDGELAFSGGLNEAELRQRLDTASAPRE
ncbi:MAG: thioredoxin family protein [Gammaproteobacteria bacterium]|nr:thioredoxin family protein [Gammaproteobacteria bacterium]